MAKKVQSKPDAKAWASLPEALYRATSAALVHYSVKTVNSNASAGGVRLTLADRLELPYVSGRTWLATGASLAVDYTANAGKTATAVRQMRAVARGEIEDAPSSEVELIRALLAEVLHVPMAIGLEPVDARLRQILIPKTDAIGGYVSLTPLTAGGVCDVLLGRGGLLDTHNEARKTEVETNRVSIRRVHLGVGGANPQNVGALVRSMQLPLLAPAPRARSSLRSAFSIYHRGIRLPSLRTFVLALRTLRERNSDAGIARSDLRTRETQLEILRSLMATALTSGDEALQQLLDYEPSLPQEYAMGTGFEIISRSVRPAIRGLIDPRLRGPDWTAQLAELLVGQIEQTTITHQGERIAALPLDGSARAGLTSQLKELAR